MKKQKKKYRRSDDKVPSREGAVLKYLRESRKLSLRKVGVLIGKSDTFISHLEHGRSDFTPRYGLKLLNFYGNL